MQKWFSLLMVLGMAFTIPVPASAQGEIKLDSLNIQLWPEYDQPSMLVLYDFTISENTSLPVKLTFRLPLGANVIAVAYEDGAGNLVNASFIGPVTQNEWQALTINVDTPTTYHFEYYQALTTSGNTRQFSYLWPGDYAVDAFKISVQEPLDMTSFTSEPALQKTQRNGVAYHESSAVNLAADEQFPLNIQYAKSTNTLRSPSGVQTLPIDSNTEGRTYINNYVPYILGGIGVLLIVGGLTYYFQSMRGKGSKTRSRRRHRVEEDEAGSIHCHQCGTRAHPGDRFCRTCGTRLRTNDQ